MLQLEDAIERDDESTVITLLDSGAVNINEILPFSGSPLNVACVHGGFNMVKLLLERKANINQTIHGNVTPLYNACLFSKFDIANLLILNGANINIGNFMGDSPLMNAVACMNVNIVTLLLDRKADINHINHYNESALSMAFMSPRAINKIIARLLMDKGANLQVHPCIDLRNNEWACMQEQVLKDASIASFLTQEHATLFRGFNMPCVLTHLFSQYISFL